MTLQLQTSGGSPVAATAAQILSVRKDLGVDRPMRVFTRAEFDAAVTAEKTRITQGSTFPWYVAGERLYIIGEEGYRSWIVGVDAANSNARTVVLGGGKSYLLPSDASTVAATTDSPPASGTGVDGSMLVNLTTGVAYLKTSGTWAAVLNIPNNGGTTPLTFATALPFRYQRGSMGLKFMTGPVAFTVDTSGALDDMGVVIGIAANGTNVPTFSADFHEDGTSSGYVNTGDNISGVINTLAVWREFGIYKYAWSQTVDLAQAYLPDAIKPTIASMAIGNATPTLVNVTMSEAIAGVLPAASAFTVTVNGAGRTVNSVAGVDTTHFNLVLASAAVFGDVVLATYTKPGSNPLKDNSGNEADTQAGITVANNVSGSNVAVRFGSLTSVTESGDGTAGWNYTHDGTGSGFSGLGLSTLSLASTADGSISYVNGSASVGAHFLGLKSVATPGTYANMAYGLRGVNPGTGFYRVIIAGAEAAATNSITGAVGDIVRLRIDRTTAQCIIEVARAASPTTWINVHTYTGVPVTRYYFAINMSQTNLQPMLNFRGVGVS